MFLSRYSTLSLVGFALLASACAGDTGVQKPMHVDAIDQGENDEHDEEKELTDDVDAGSEPEADASQSEADAGSAESDAGSEPEADAGDDEEEAKGMPCEVELLLRTHCQGCHSAMAKNGVPLMTLENLMAPSKADANTPVYARVAARISSAERPMPPMGKGTPVTAEELAAFQAWVDQGAPADGCEP
jgi:mono/diheme cytochrome c family protein